MSKTYHGYRSNTTGLDGQPITSHCVVRVTVGKRQRVLRPRNDIRDHSPDGFEWGYCGSGPAQLALALVADCCGSKMAIPAIYQRVKEEIVAGLPHDGWTLTEEQVRTAAQKAWNEAMSRE